MPDTLIQWLLNSSEPWTRYLTHKDLLDCDEQAPELQAARADMLSHPQVQSLIAETAVWPGYALRRHNDAGPPLYKFSTLADFGFLASDPGMPATIQAVMAHQSPQGAFQSLVNIPKAFGGADEDTWTWILCDAPTLLYSLLSMGIVGNEQLQPAIDQASAVDPVGRAIPVPSLPSMSSKPCRSLTICGLVRLPRRAPKRS